MRQGRNKSGGNQRIRESLVKLDFQEQYAGNHIVVIVDEICIGTLNAVCEGAVTTGLLRRAAHATCSMQSMQRVQPAWHDSLCDMAALNNMPACETGLGGHEPFGVDKAKPHSPRSAEQFTKLLSPAVAVPPLL